MYPTSTVALLLLLTSKFLCANTALTELKADKILRDSKKYSNNESVILMTREDNLSRQKIVQSEQTEKIFTTAIPTTVTFSNKNLQSTTKRIPIAFEAKDMEESIVHPKDEDDGSVVPVISKPRNNSNATVASIESTTTTTLYDMMKEDEKHATLPAKIFPDNPDKSIADFPLDVQRKFTHETYFIGIDEANATKASASDVSIVPVTSKTIETLNISTAQGSFLTLETREEMVKKHSDLKTLESKNETEKMPPGVIGLLSAIGFAAIAVFAYFSLIGWKRYQEYLHGHRELLVNDFDSNDINNFEL